MARDTRRPSPIGYISDPGEMKKDEQGVIPQSQIINLNDWLKSLSQRFNGQISFGSGAIGTVTGNLDATTEDVYFPLANTEVTVVHQLGRVPVLYFQGRADRACRVYDSRQNSWTDRIMYLKCDTAGALVKVVIA